MHDRIAQLKESFLADLEAARSPIELETIRIKYLARKGEVAALFDALREVPAEEKPATGKALNELRSTLQAAFDARKDALSGHREPSAAGVDVTLPGRPKPVGTLHPITQTVQSMIEIFGRMGFSVASVP